MGIGFLGAFVGGLLTLLSPCSVMLLPAFFSYAFSRPSQLVARTGVFYLGLITTLVPLGVLAGTLGAFVNANRELLVTIAGIIVIVLGAIMLLNVPLPFLRGGSAAEGTSGVAVYALGTVYGLAGVCAGPLLGAVLTVAAVSGSALYGGLVLLFFAAGMAAPLLVLALVWGRLPFVKRFVRPRELRIGPWRNTWTGIVSGAVTIALGMLLLVTDGTAALTGVLGASEQIALEAAAGRAADRVPDAVVVIAVLALAAAGWGVSRVLRRRQLRAAEDA
ncbi:cytochrome c biogenesis CcdA family protein [Microbacterium halophytorum]|uniref:cytochrome c biogenesis CcdA family protein n=1 Tax=Microbacterium halophytorum TaxID=2067568 RepID=UPI000CFB7F8A|nr:cytochrome c biogenesis CcdA family protein [Microbacterium halophytorum]